MTSASDHEDDTEHVLKLARGPGRRRSLSIKWTAAGAALLGLAVLGPGCGGSNSPGIASSGQLVGGVQASTPSAQKIAAEVKWARCVRSHGLPSFPDPDSDGAFDSSKFDDSSPAFQTASNACKSVQPAAISVHAGRGNVSGP